MKPWMNANASACPLDFVEDKRETKHHHLALVGENRTSIVVPIFLF